MTQHATSGDLTRRRLFGLGLSATTAAALAACGGGKTAGETAGGGARPAQTFSTDYQGPAITLSYWNGFTGGDGPFMTTMVAQFMKENPKITIKSNTVEWAQYYQRMPAAVTAGKGPDVGVMHVDQLATNAARKTIVPVDDLATALQLTESDFTPEVWQAAIYQGARYGIPLDVHSLGMYMNTEAFTRARISEPPSDRESFEGALDDLRAVDFATPFWMPTRWPAHLMFLSLLWQNGGQPYAPDGSRATYDSDAGVAALSWMVDMIKRGYSPKSVAQDSQYVAFKNRKVPVTWDGIWQINDLKAGRVPFRLMPVPQIGSQPAVWANSHHFYISRQSASDDNKMQAARIFIDWISRRSAEWAGSGMIPARRAVRESSAVEQSAQGPIASEIDQMRFLPAIPGVGDVQAQTLEIGVADATLLRSSPAAALHEQAAKATKLMQANLKKFGG
jgi:multiple sugar transport system substrate-binding protein